jgi:NAD(P)-dependent dehydrogenase (short-subunit alcohol dehydrogenase family)
MKGNVCIVTGANAGIGKETALSLAKKGASVVMVARSRERGEAARDAIRAESGNENVDLMLADLSVQDDIYDLAQAFRTRYDRLDVLVNNAGAIFMERKESADGLEITFALNHMGYFILTNLLLDMLKASAPARIINVSSDAHRGASLDFNDLQHEESYSGFDVYGESKLMNILFTHELARRLEGTGVTANSVHPGFVGSNFAKNNGLLARIAMTVLRPFARSPEKGAETPIYLASSPEVAGVNGEYFKDKEAKRSSRASYNEETARRLWEVSESLTQVPLGVG